VATPPFKVVTRRPWVAASTGSVTPTFRGVDIVTPTGNFDGHVRLERVTGEPDASITIDIFESADPDPNKAPAASESFQNTPEGAREATEWLAEWGFRVEVKQGGL